VTKGFQWCPHCKRPHGLAERLCTVTGRPLDGALHHVSGGVALTRVGSVLGGKYRLLDLIGAGGMGQVYEAENLHMRRLVAIKVVASAGGPQAFVRLEREAQHVAAIQHPNICAVLDFGRTPSGGPYVVFERLFGVTLGERMRRAGQLSVRAALDIFSQILSGLHAAHTSRILHRDLKPQNVFLVDRAGCPPLVKLVDFGFAQDLSARGNRITRPGHLCGTVQYMSPEQLRAEPLDHRSDLFAVGTMLYEALAGRHPFEAQSRVDLQTNILRAAPPPLRSRRPDLSRELEQIIAWALARLPAARPSSALDLQRALQSVVRSSLPSLGDDEPVSVTEPNWFPPSSSPEA
jgi:eukaryotic-like serine/threonine-protein kinase